MVYDRHMNLVLGNVTEWCTPFRTVANGGITQTKKHRKRKENRTAANRSDAVAQGQGASDASEGQKEEAPHSIPETEGTEQLEKWEVCRNVKQLFIRGDNIVHITAACRA